MADPPRHPPRVPGGRGSAGVLPRARCPSPPAPASPARALAHPRPDSRMNTCSFENRPPARLGHPAPRSRRGGREPGERMADPPRARPWGAASARLAHPPTRQGASAAARLPPRPLQDGRHSKRGGSTREAMHGHPRPCHPPRAFPRPLSPRPRALPGHALSMARARRAARCDLQGKILLQYAMFTEIIVKESFISR